LTAKIRDPLPEPCAVKVLLHGWSQDLKTPDALLVRDKFPLVDDYGY